MFCCDRDRAGSRPSLPAFRAQNQFPDGRLRWSELVAVPAFPEAAFVAPETGPGHPVPSPVPNSFLLLSLPPTSEDLSCDVQSNSCGGEGSASEAYLGLARLEETGPVMALSDGWSISAGHSCERSNLPCTQLPPQRGSRGSGRHPGNRGRQPPLCIPAGTRTLGLDTKPLPPQMAASVGQCRGPLASMELSCGPVREHV